MSNIPIEKQVFDKNTYNKIIDTNFNQLNNNNENVSPFTLDDFFSLYEQLFYQIPKEGETNSHRFILQKEADYLGVMINEDDVQALLSEITLLRQQALDFQQIIKDLSITSK